MDDIRKELLRSWMTKAGSDLRSARLLGAAEEAPLDTAVYHCQQAAEKSVKAFLVHCGITPEKTHDIRKLTLEAIAREPRFKELMDMAAALTPYAWEFRYPDDLSETCPTREEFDEALQHAQTFTISCCDCSRRKRDPERARTRDWLDECFEQEAARGLPSASPRLLWRMKVVTHREKDAGDLVFLRQWFAERGEQPPGV